MMRRGFLILSVMMLFLPFVWGAAVGDNALFAPAEEPAGPPTATDPAAVEIEYVTVNWSVLDGGAATELEVSLTGDAQLAASRLRRDPAPQPDGYVWVGQSGSGADVSLSVVGETLVGRVVLADGTLYEIRPAAGDVHVIRRIDESRRVEPPPVEDGVVVPAGDYDPPAAAPRCEDGSQIDLLIAYTSAARVFAGGTATIQALINQRVSDMNSANSQSQVNTTFNLVHTMETGYAETGNVSNDLPRLQNTSDGFLDDVTAARETHRADLVGLYISEAQSGGCGVGYVMTNESTGFAPYAVQVSALDYVDPYFCSDLTLAHEFGHNMGNVHDRDNSSFEGVFPYSYGYQDPGESFRTIMAYNCPGGCPRVNHWSNPDVTYNGLPTGVDYDVNPGAAADVARSMNEVRDTVANFRENCAPNTPTPTATHTPVPTNTPTSTTAPTATSTHTPVATLTSTATSTPPVTQSPTPGPSPTRTPWHTPTPSLTPAASPTAAPELDEFLFLPWVGR